MTRILPAIVCAAVVCAFLPSVAISERGTAARVTATSTAKHVGKRTKKGSHRVQVVTRGRVVTGSSSGCGAAYCIPNPGECSGGRVLVRIKLGRRTVSARTRKLSDTCTFSSRVIFENPFVRRSSSVHIHAEFLGNAALRPTRPAEQVVRIR